MPPSTTHMSINPLLMDQHLLIQFDVDFDHEQHAFNWAARILEDFAQDQVMAITIDLNELNQVTSRFFSNLLALARYCEKQQLLAPRLRRCSPAVEKGLWILNMSELFRIERADAN